MHSISDILAILQQDEISIEAKQDFLLLNKETLLMEKNLDLKLLLASFDASDARNEMEGFVLRLITDDLPNFPSESKAAITTHLRELSQEYLGVNSELLALRLRLLSRISPFDFIELLSLPMVQSLDIHSLIQICRDVVLGENAVARKEVILKLSNLLHAELRTDLDSKEKLVALCIHAFVALYPRLQNIYELEKQYQRRAKSGALKSSLIAEITHWVEYGSEWAEQRVDMLIQLIGDLEALTEDFRKAHSPDAFRRLAGSLASLLSEAEVFVYALDETRILDCLGGSSRVAQQRILVKENPIIEHNLDLANVVLNHQSHESNSFQTIVPLVMIGKLRPLTIGALIIKTKSKIEFGDLISIAIVLPSVSRAAVELIAIDRERKLTDLNVGLDYLQHQFRKPASTISSRLDYILAVTQLPPNDPLKDGLENLKLLNDYSIFITHKIGSTVELERGRYLPTFEKVDLLQLVQETLGMLDSYHFPVREKGKELKILNSKSCSVLADPYLLKLAVGELIENAIDFARKQVTVSISQSDRDCIIEVRDDGQILPEKEKRYFKEQFSSRQGGTGKGLLFVRNAAKIQGGDADYRNDNGKVFYISLPKRSKTEFERHLK